MDFKVEAESFIDDIIRIVDGLTAGFIKQGFEGIVNSWVGSGLLSSILSLYLLNFLYQMKFYKQPVTDGALHIIKVCFVFLIATNWSIFYILIFNVFTNGPLEIMQAMLKNKGTSLHNGSLNDTFFTGINQAVALLVHMPFSPKGVAVALLSALLLLVGTALFTLVALALIVMSKFYLAVLLALAPYFLLMFLFNGSKGLFESWFKSCLNHALIPVFLGCVLLLTTILAKACMGVSAEDGQQGPGFVGIILYVCAGLISAFLMKIVPEKTASLTASLAVAGVGRVGRFAESISSSVKQGSSKTKSSISSAKESFATRQQKLHDNIHARAEKRRAEELDARERRASRVY